MSVHCREGYKHYFVSQDKLYKLYNSYKLTQCPHNLNDKYLFSCYFIHLVWYHRSGHMLYDQNYF